MALWVVPNVEVYDFIVREYGERNPWPRLPHPDVCEYALRDYGNQAGLHRVVNLLDQYPVRVTVSLNLDVCARYPTIADMIRSRGWDIMCHGLSNTDYVYGWSAERERNYYLTCAERLWELFERPMNGVLGPAISATENTCDILAELGVLYHADWLHDDVPTPLRVSSGRLISLPYSCELNDVPQYRRGYDGAYFAAAAKAQFDELYREGEDTGRVMCLPLHPYLVGRPHMISYVAEVLEHICSHDSVWYATGTEIAEFYVAHYVNPRVGT